MIYFVRALGREPHGEPCIEAFFMARFAGYPDESRVEPSSARDSSSIKANLATTLACCEIRLLSLHDCRSTLVYMLHV